MNLLGFFCAATCLLIFYHTVICYIYVLKRFRVIFPRFITQGGMALPLRAVGPLLFAFFLLYSFINISILFCNGLFVFGRICGLKRVPPLILLLPLARLWPDLFLFLYTAIIDILYHMECVMECTEFVHVCVCVCVCVCDLFDHLFVYLD